MWGEFSFSFLFFLFLRGGFVGRLLVTFGALFDGERIVIFIFTNGYDCSFVGRLLVNYVAVNHFIDAAAQPTAINFILLSVVIYAHLHAPPLVRFHKQEREEVPAPRVLEDPREKGFTVKVNVFAHNFSIINHTLFSFFKLIDFLVDIIHDEIRGERQFHEHEQQQLCQVLEAWGQQ